MPNTLQILGEEEKEPDHRGEEQDTRQIGADPLAVGKEPERHDRLPGAMLVDHEERKKQKTHGKRCERQRIVRPLLRRTDDAIDQRRHAERRAYGARKVEFTRAPFRFADVLVRREHQGDADRQVDEETDPPAEPAGKQTAEHHAEARADAGDRTVIGDRPRAFRSLGKIRLDQRQRGGGEDRRAEALHGARAKQPFRRRCQPDHDGGRCEDGKPGNEQPTPAENVARPRAQQQEAAKGERIGAVHPGKPGVAELQLVANLRQAGDHDRDIEHDHQVADDDDRQHRRLAG
ncbi:hypothetical protein D9M70_491620 [compost metagenome]